MRCKRTLYQLRASVLPICDTEHGLLPTVVTQGLKVHGKSGSEPLSPAMLPTPVASDCGSGRVNRSLSKGASERPTLALAARMGLLSMPTACDAKNNSFPLSHAKRKSGAVHDVSDFASVPNWEGFLTESPICGPDDGLSAGLDGITFPAWRRESIKAYGNTIVPQVALRIFETINEYEKQ